MGLKVRVFWRSLVDIRKGEYLPTLFMSLYLLFVLCAYYILKPVSRALFLDEFAIEKLPLLYILIALVGGWLAYGYTKLAVRTSLGTAVTSTTIVSIGFLAAFWWLLRLDYAWTHYAFNIWVSLFSIVLVSQGWLVAANVFNPRQAKRLYVIVGVGAIIGAALGAAFTGFAVERLGTTNLVLASALMVGLAYASFRALAAQEGICCTTVSASADGETFSLHEVASGVRRHRHLQVIIAILTVTYVVDTLVEFQFSAMAKQAHSGDQLTSFLGFYGLYLNLVTIVLQFFLTAWVTTRFGVGGVLQIMPISVGLASLAAFLSPGLLSATFARLAESSTRHSFNRTGMELLYLPLPLDVRNRTKTLMDIFVDRMARGLGGLLLVPLTVVLQLEPHQISLVAVALCGFWVYLSHRARREYIGTVRKRLEARRLDLESVRFSVRDPATLKLLEQAAESSQPRQARYALRLLSEDPRYPLEPLLERMANHPSPDARREVYEISRRVGFDGLLERARAELDAIRPNENFQAITGAVHYLAALSPDARQLMQGLLSQPDHPACEEMLQAMADHPELAVDLLTRDWLSSVAADAEPRRRCLAAVAVGVRGDEGIETLHRLLADEDRRVAAAAVRAAGRLGNRAYLGAIIPKLADSQLRGATVEALAAYGERILGTLQDILRDESTPVAVRRQLPRVLSRIPAQRSVDILLNSIGQKDLTVRAAALRALGRLRQRAPGLQYGSESVTRQILDEARYYFELNASLEPFREQSYSRPAARLLARTLEERLARTIDRLFSLLGLQYPPKAIDAAHLAVQRGRTEEFSAALEFLDNVLDHELKKFLLPLLENSGQLAESGKYLFGVEIKDTESAVRDLILSGDAWLVACAIATAAELKLSRLTPDIARAARQAGADVDAVARSAIAALA